MDAHKSIRCYLIGTKRRVSLFLVLTLMLSLAACGKKKSEAAIAVDEKILAIGVVDVHSNAKITEAEEEYSKLSDKDRGQLEYYGTLTDARTTYNNLIEGMISEANTALDNLDMKKAYKLANDLPEEQKDEAERIKKKVDSLCYKDTFLAKLENVTSSLPKSTNAPDKALSGGLTYGHQYANFTSLQSALNDYYKYMSKYYTSADNKGLSYDQYSMSAQIYEFKDEKGHKIKVSGSNVLGFYYLNIVVEENVNYRNVVN